MLVDIFYIYMYVSIKFEVSFKLEVKQLYITHR